MPGTSLPSSSTDGTNVTNGAPIFGGSSCTTPRSRSRPKSSRRGRSIRSGKRTPGIRVKRPRVDSAGMAVPSPSRGTALAGGSTPAEDHGAGVPEARAALAGHGVDLGGVGEREQTADGAGRVQRRLTEALVELSAARAGDVRDDAVEDPAAGLVLVQAEIEEVTEKAAGL